MRPMLLEINDRIRIPESEWTFTFVRSGGPGGQNVNKVASKAVLRWGMAQSPSIPEEVRSRLRTQQRRRITSEGDLLVTSQRYRDHERNRLDCLEKLQAILREATRVPRARKKTKPSPGSHRRRLADKRRRSARKQERGRVTEE
jgi:ribosome-associated protein